MTPEDLQQIRAVVQEVVREVVREEIKAQQLITRADLDRAMETVADEFSQLRKEMKSGFDLLERRTERMENSLNSMLMQTAGMSKSLSEAERIDSSFASQLNAQQRAIDDLYRQIAELKRQQPPH
jgi:hypothetical protein